MKAAIRVQRLPGDSREKLTPDTGVGVVCPDPAHQFGIEFGAIAGRSRQSHISDVRVFFI